MPRTPQPPRLYLRKRGPKSAWVIRHGDRMIALGLQEEDRARADDLLNNYVAALDETPGIYTPPQIMAQDGLIYFVTCDTPDFPIKIGWTTDTSVRIRSMQTALPYKIILLATRPGRLDEERALHLRFFDSRLEGEWFERTPELLAYIQTPERHVLIGQKAEDI